MIKGILVVCPCEGCAEAIRALEEARIRYFIFGAGWFPVVPVFYSNEPLRIFVGTAQIRSFIDSQQPGLAQAVG